MSVTPKEFSKDDFLDHLQTADVLDATTAARVRAASELSGAPLERAILELGLASEDTVFEALANYLGLPFIRQTDIDPELTDRLGLEPQFLDRVSAIPVRQEPSSLQVATTSVDSTKVLQGISFFLSTTVSPAITTPTTIRNSLEGFAVEEAHPAHAAETDIDRLRVLANDGPIVKYVNDVVARAVSQSASDIHFEAQENGARIRFRVDGALSHEGIVSSDKLAAVVSRVKVMAELNISEKRRPQDGRITTSVRGRNVDIRVSTLPTQFGESVVMRLLDQESVELDWSALGFQPGRIQSLRQIVKQPNGIFLVAGPTGSGKTTTLYTALKEINQEDRKIVTVEDPVEYSMEGVNQTQVEMAIDMTFAKALRAILRQDPDVVMVGEIRDQETAEIAVRAALIGRLVLSTVHTNDSLSAITRLVDLGVPEFLLASTLRGVLSQRLVRRICRECEGQGGPCCKNSGAKGRQVISELLSITPAVSEAIAKGESPTSLLALAKEQGFTTMRTDADRVLASGSATREAVERAIGSDL